MKEQMSEVGLERTESLLMRDGEGSKPMILNKTLKREGKYKGIIRILELEQPLRELTTK